MTTPTVRAPATPGDGRALRRRLDEGAWATAVAAAELSDLPTWATPQAPASGADEGREPPLVDGLRLRERSVLAVDVATTARGMGVLAALVTDLTAVVGVVRRLAVPEGAGLSGTRALPGVEVDVTTIDHVVDEVLRLLPPAADDGGLVEAELPEEHTVALGRAVRTGDTATVEAICADEGWASPPGVLVALVHELVGTAVVTVRRHGTGPLVGEWLLTRRGWVELVRTPRATVRHVPRSREDIARTLVTALTGASTAVLAQADAAARGQEADPPHDDGGGRHG